MTKLSEIDAATLTRTTKTFFGKQAITEVGIDVELSPYEASLLSYLKQIAENTKKV